MTSDNHVTGPVSDAMIEAGRNAMVSDEWSSMIDLNRLPQAYLAMKSKEQASAHSPDEVELVTDAIVAAIKADCTEPNGNCYAVGNRDAMEVDGEFDPEAIARAAIVTMKSKWKRGEASVHSPDEVEQLKCDIGDAIRSEENPVKTGDDYATGFNNGLRLARRVVFTLLDRAAISRTDDRLREALADIAETMPGRTHNEASAQRREIARAALETPAKGMGE